MKGAESTRLSIRMRGGSLGHHQALEKEERFSRLRSDEIGAARLGARRDGRGAGLLRRELERRRRRRRSARPRRRRSWSARPPWARSLGSTCTPTDDETPDEARERDHEALRGDRPPDHEPHGRRRAVRPEPDRRRARRPATSGAWRRRSSVRRTSRRTTSCVHNKDAVERSPTRSSSGRSSSATSCSSCSTSANLQAAARWTTRRTRRGRGS